MAKEMGPSLEGMTCEEKLGEGGYSEVWLYQQEFPRQQLAVKVLKDDARADTQLDVFVREANTMAALDHPNIVGIQKAGTTTDGRPYLVMKYYPPPDLWRRVTSEPMKAADVLRYGIQLASAVQTAHLAGIIHRDIKPANILVDQYDDPALTDFGIAGHADVSETGEELGVSVPWSPPEVLLSQSNGSYASDIYSLGATLWNLLAGHPPFARPGDRSDREQLARILHGNPPSTGLAAVPSSFERLLAVAMAKNPSLRPRSALELAKQLLAVEAELGLPPTKFVLREAPETPIQSIAVQPPPALLVDLEHDEDVTMLRRPKRVEPVLPPARARKYDLPEHRPSPALVVVSDVDVTQSKPAAPVVQPEDDRTRPETTSRSTGALLGIGVALLLVVAIGIGIALATNGDDPGPQSVPTSNPSELDDVLGGFTPLITPDIKVTVDGSTVTFSAAPEASEDVFVWRLQRNGQDYRNVKNTADGRTVSVDAPGSACAELRVRREGALSDALEKCWP